MKGIACDRCLNEMLGRLNHLAKRQLYLHFDEACKLTRSRNNMDDIVSRLWTGNRGTVFRSTEVLEIFLFSAKLPLALWLVWLPVQWVMGLFSR